MVFSSSPSKDGAALLTLLRASRRPLKNDPRAELKPEIDPMAMAIHGSLRAHVDAQARIDHAPGERVADFELVASTRE